MDAEQCEARLQACDDMIRRLCRLFPMFTKAERAHAKAMIEELSRYGLTVLRRRDTLEWNV